MNEATDYDHDADYEGGLAELIECERQEWIETAPQREAPQREAAEEAKRAEAEAEARALEWFENEIETQTAARVAAMKIEFEAAAKAEAARIESESQARIDLEVQNAMWLFKLKTVNRLAV